MNLNSFKNNRILIDILITLVLGVMSYVFANIQFIVPGFNGIKLNLREIPLLLSIFYLRNPLFIIGVSIITSLNTAPNQSEIINFFMRASGLFAMYFINKKIKQLKFDVVIKSVLFGLAIVFIYYDVLYIVFSVLSVLLDDSLSYTLKDFMQFLLKSAWIESLFTAFVVVVLFIHHEIRQNLEGIVADRTKKLTDTLVKLQATQQELIQSEKMSSLRLFTSGIAHEINNPLNFINGALHLLNDSKEKNSDKEECNNLTQIYNMIKSGYERIHKILRNLTYFSYYKNDVLHKKDIHKVIGMALIVLRSSIPKDIKVRTSYKLKTKVPIFSDKMHNVLLNLLENAIYACDYTDSEEKLIEISTLQVANNAYIEIFNTGKNIPYNDLTKIFDPFFTTKSPQEGTGLGLSICYTLINTYHKGNLIAQNLPNGVKFTIIIPLSGDNN